jgi:putative transcriptional regulator
VILHHPSEATLAAYAAGSLREALALVVATHLGQCAGCEQSLATLEATGGALLQDLSPVPLSADALARLSARMDEAAPRTPPVLNPDLPAPLNRVALGRWWPVGRGIRYRPFQVSGAARGGLLRVHPGRSLLPHGHAGLELTCVLSGAFVDGSLTYSAGDLAEPTADHDEPPVAVGVQPCLCVLAFEGMRLRGLLGWVQRAIFQ